VAFLEEVLDVVPGDLAAQRFGGVLVVAEVNAAVDARVRDISDDLVEPVVMQLDSGNARRRVGEGVVALAVCARQDGACGPGSGAGPRWVARKAWRGDKRLKGGVRRGPFVAVVTSLRAEALQRQSKTSK
jgi:hypothetical protein